METATQYELPSAFKMYPVSAGGKSLSGDPVLVDTGTSLTLVQENAGRGLFQAGHEGRAVFGWFDTVWVIKAMKQNEFRCSFDLVADGEYFRIPGDSIQAYRKVNGRGDYLIDDGDYGRMPPKTEVICIKNINLFSGEYFAY